jgi:hypothetical protein
VTFPCTYILYPELVYPLHFSFFYLSPFLMVISTGLKILYFLTLVLHILLPILALDYKTYSLGLYLTESCSFALYPLSQKLLIFGIQSSPSCGLNLLLKSYLHDYPLHFPSFTSQAACHFLYNSGYITGST